MALAPRKLILATFFLQAFGASGVFPRMADLQAGLGLTDASFGMLLTAPAVGALMSFLFAPAVLEQTGTRSALILAIALNATAVLLIGAAGSVVLAAAAFWVFGASFSLANVAMNVEADRVEALTGARVMNRCHGLWGLGTLAAAFVGTGASAIAATPLIQFAATLPVVLIGIRIVLIPMQPAPARTLEGKAPKRPRRLVRPTQATMMLVAFGTLASLSEGVVRNWSVIFMRDTFTAPNWLDTLTLPAFLVMLSAGRMLADGWADRLGPRLLARRLIAVAFCGLCLVVLAPNLGTALAGFALIGLGICVVFPLTISAAAQLGDRPAAENVASVTVVNALANLAAPPVIGLVAQYAGIRAAFAMMIPLFVLSLAVANRVLPER